MLTIIMAAEYNGGIGNKGGLPWPKDHVDMMSFIRHTVGKTCICSKNTYFALQGKLPLRQLVIADREWTHVDWLNFAKSPQEYMVLGGPAIYKLAAPYTEEFILHRIRGEYECDTFSPFPLPWVRKDIVNE